MNAIKFIEQRLNILVNDYPHVKCSYKYEDSCSTHFIEILPSSIYENDRLYADAEEGLISDFFDLNIPESICFISENSLVKMESPSLVIEGKLYASEFILYSDTLFEIIIQTSFTGNILNKAIITNDNLQLVNIGESSYAMAA